MVTTPQNFTSSEEDPVFVPDESEGDVPHSYREPWKNAAVKTTDQKQYWIYKNARGIRNIIMLGGARCVYVPDTDNIGKITCVSREQNAKTNPIYFLN